MKYRWFEFRNLIRRIGAGALIVFITVALLFAGISYAISRMLVAHYESDLVKEQALIATDASHDLHDYLSTADAVLFAGKMRLDMLMSEGADTDQIKDYLTELASVSLGLLGEGNIYGYINGEFVTSDRETEVGFSDITKTSWYTSALAAQGEPVLVDPYQDQLSGELVFSKVIMLDDGKSVLALNLSIQSLQQITQTIQQNTFRESLAFIIDNSGRVVTHTDPTQIGKDYARTEDSFGKLFYASLSDDPKDFYSLSVDNVQYIVYCIQESGWYCVSAVNATAIYQRIYHMAAVIDGVIAIIFILIIILFLYMAKRRYKAEDLSMELESIAAIYDKVYVLDTKTNVLRVTLDRDLTSEKVILRGKEFITNSIVNISDKRSLDSILEFTNFDTVQDRLQVAPIITQEFLSTDNKWYRARFVKTTDAEGFSANLVIWMLEEIDEEKRQRERLIYLSETDQMTGLFNRSSGEKKVRDLLLNDEEGMFLYFDADHFKSINDTYGHAVGDQVVITIADCIRHTFRNNDISIRMGGDEFAIFAHGITSKETADVLIQRFFEALQTTSILELDRAPITVSIGVAFCHKGDSLSFEELYDKVDKATYFSKKSTGNSVTYYDEIKDAGENEV